MKKIQIALQILLGIALLIFGMNGIFSFLPVFVLPKTPQDFLNSLNNSGYIIPLISGLKVVVGLMLVVNVLPAFALILLAPLSVNIVLFHIMIDPEGLALGAPIATLNIALAWFYREQYYPLFKN